MQPGRLARLSQRVASLRAAALRAPVLSKIVIDPLSTYFASVFVKDGTIALEDAVVELFP